MTWIAKGCLTNHLLARQLHHCLHFRSWNSYLVQFWIQPYSYLAPNVDAICQRRRIAIYCDTLKRVSPSSSIYERAYPNRRTRHPHEISVSSKPPWLILIKCLASWHLDNHWQVIERNHVQVIGGVSSRQPTDMCDSTESFALHISFKWWSRFHQYVIAKTEVHGIWNQISNASSIVEVKQSGRWISHVVSQQSSGSARKA
jgi:hypothetical protein